MQSPPVSNSIAMRLTTRSGRGILVPVGVVVGVQVAVGVGVGVCDGVGVAVEVGVGLSRMVVWASPSPPG